MRSGDKPAPAVSVVIPLYNKSATIERALRSVYAQEFSGFELVVVDDGSTDGSGEIAQTISDDRTIVMRQANAGPGAARNNGAAASHGALLAFLDADDEWRPDFLRTATEALERHPECVAYVCGYDSGQFRSERPNKVQGLGKPKGPAALDVTLTGKMIKMHVDALHSSSVVVRRSVFEQAGGFFQENRCTYGEDSYLWMQVLFAGPIFWDPSEHVHFHVEDSELGFATTLRKQARPISLHGPAIGRRYRAETRDAFGRVMKEYVERDVHILIASRSFPQAFGLRRLHHASLSVLARDAAKATRVMLRSFLRRG